MALMVCFERGAEVRERAAMDVANNVVFQSTEKRSGAIFIVKSRVLKKRCVKLSLRFSYC